MREWRLSSPSGLSSEVSSSIGRALRETHLLFAVPVEVSENWNGFTLSKRSLGPTRSCVALSLGAQAYVVRPLQAFVVPFGKDLLEWDVAFHETFARWLLSLFVLLCWDVVFNETFARWLLSQLVLLCD